MFPTLKVLWTEAREQKGEMGVWAIYTLLAAAFPIWWVAIDSLFSSGRLPGWIETFGSTGDLLLVAVALTADAAARIVQAMTGPGKKTRSINNTRLGILTFCGLNILVTTLLFANVSAHLDEKRSHIESAQARIEQDSNQPAAGVLQQNVELDALLAALREKPVQYKAVAIASLIVFGASVVIAMSAILSEDPRK